MAAAGAALGACTFGERAIAPGLERAVVHAVLNPAAESQFVLVERTLSGRVTVRVDSLAAPDDPIVGGGGVPVHGARVVVTDSAGATITADETTVLPAGSRTPRGTGMYRFANLAVPGGVGLPRRGLRIVPGGRYALRVVTPDSQVVTGSTRVPGDARTRLAPDIEALTFLRNRDTLRLAWAPVPGARTYALRIESPYGAFFLFTDSTTFRLTGDLRNLFAERLPRVLQAGFTQRVYVAAVDTAYYDYYRSQNSPFTGSGIISRLSGGIGLLGAYVPLQERVLFVRAEDREPIDGRYVGAGPQGPELLRLWVDARAGGIAEVTGAYRLPTQEQFGVLGTLEGTRLRLRAVEDNDGRIVFRTLDGEVRGDTIRVQLAGAVPSFDDGRRVFVRQRDTTAAPGGG